MSRGLTSKKDCVAAIRLCLVSDLGRIDWWIAQRELPKRAADCLSDARIRIDQAIRYVEKAEKLMPEEKKE